MKLPPAPARTTPAFGFSTIERALNDCLGRRLFGKREQDKVIGFFGKNPPECVFCGSPHVQRWDHLVPVCKGGETILGNMVPACARCDDAKRQLTFEEFMDGSGGHAPLSRGVADVQERKTRLRAYMEHFVYTPTILEQRLSEQERTALDRIRKRLEESRQEVKELVDAYRKRTGDR